MHDRWTAANRANWNERTGVHLEAYPVVAFLAGETTLRSVELDEVGDVVGRTLLHLQCHFGLDTLSWARRGAVVTGIDLSDAAIAAARRLSAETGIAGRFIQGDLFDVAEALDEQFDIVFTSYGVLVWLADLTRWARAITRWLRPGGHFHIVEFHPLLNLIADDGSVDPEAGYFHDPTPGRYERHGSYVGEPRPFTNPVTYQWQHTLGDVVTALTGAGLRLDFLHEWPVSANQLRPSMVLGDDGWWHLPGDRWPLLFSLKATRPA